MKQVGMAENVKCIYKEQMISLRVFYVNTQTQSHRGALNSLQGYKDTPTFHIWTHPSAFMSVKSSPAEVSGHLDE